jgi:plastocyanin
MRRFLLTLVAAGAIAACSSSSSHPVAQPPPSNLGATVTLKDIAFNPKVVTIHAGQAVQWVWSDGSVPHNVNFPDFHSVIQSSGGYSHTFATAGSYEYNCTIHSGMTGRVEVAP